MKISQQMLASIVESTGFQINQVEKVIQLINLLNAINSHPFLKEKLVLKGGTALNLFIFNMPRLSVDIDINYIGTTPPLQHSNSSLAFFNTDVSVNRFYVNAVFAVFNRACSCDIFSG